jgi:hypothetical protein
MAAPLDKLLQRLGGLAISGRMRDEYGHGRPLSMAHAMGKRWAAASGDSSAGIHADE